MKKKFSRDKGGSAGLENNKVAGINGIPAELIKANIEITVELFYIVTTKNWNKEIILDNCKQGVITNV